MRFRVYLKPFTEEGAYQTDWIEVSDDIDMNSIADIRQVLDDDTYNVGIFKFGEFAIKLRNEHGLYSEIGSLRTIFKYKRSDTKVRVTWQFQDFESHAGVVTAGDFIPGNDEVEVFEGLLNDDASDTDIKDQVAQFKVLGLESIFARVEVPFADIANGDTVKALLLDILDQEKITDLMTVLNANLNPALNIVVDDISKYENSTVKEMLSDLLLISNSVLFLRDGILYVDSRDATADVQATFYGQASNVGVENIIEITDIRTGINKMFNYCTWDETSLIAQDIDSVEHYGVKKKSFSFEQITDSGRQQQILEAFRDEFGQPKQSFVLTVPITEEMLALGFLDRVNVDYPTVLFPPPGELIPIYGISKYGEGIYPYGAWSLTLLLTDYFKIMGKSVKTKNQHIEFYLRRV